MAILPGRRIRDNGIFGTITDAPLTIGATTFNSANLADLVAVSGNHAIVTLDPLAQHGDPEIVMITTHTAASTVATITRAMYGTVARAHPQGTLWVHAATQDDYREVVTSSTRPSDQYEGQSIYETDTDRLVSFTGTAWQQQGLFFDPPACRIRRATVQSIPNNVQTVVSFSNERYDTDNMWSAASPTRIIINTAGIYLFVFSGEVATGNDYTFYGAYISLNGTPISLGTAGGTNTVSNVGKWMNATAMWKCSAGDFVEATVQQVNSAAAARNLETAANYTPEFAATWIGRGN